MTADPSTPVDRERRALRLFDQAIDRPTDERIDFVHRRCAGDVPLRRRVLELLASDAAMATDAAFEPIAHGEPDALLGEVLGPYRLTGLLGTGGMGWVYAAERSDGQFDRCVAIKVLPGHHRDSSPDSESGLADRMRHERQILARLEHPHIARLLDGGTTPDGRPFLVMEKLDGVAIDRHCREVDASIETTIGLIQDVCAAIGFAHRHLLVHRDIKPSNVLVTSEGQVKLLDFGIAKTLGLDDDALTRTGQSPMTLRYASPEHVQSLPLTTACDVYSLGVLLYELLTGRSPYGERRGTYDLVKAICELPPTPPSRAVAERIDEADAAAPDNRFRARRHRLRGDLDAIVLKALAKAPEDRYASAEALADDLSRHLAHEPVRARRQTTGYRLKTFVRRRRMEVGAALLLIVLNLGYLGIVSAQNRAIQRESENSRAALDFLIDTFRATDATSVGRDLSGHEILDRGAAMLDASFTDRPRILGQLQLALSEAYLGIGRPNDADRWLAARLELADRDGAPRLAADEWVRLHRHRAQLTHVGEQLDEAERQARAVHERAVETLGPEHEETLRAAQVLALVWTDSGDFEAARELYDQISGRLRATLPEGHPRRIEMKRLIARHRLLSGAFTEARERTRELLTLEEERWGDGHVSVGQLEGQLCSIALFQGEDARALPHCRRGRRILAAELGDAHPTALTAGSNLATALSNVGHLDEAAEVYRASLALLAGSVGPDHVSVASGLNNLASVLSRQGRSEEALELVLRSLAIFEQRQGPRSHGAGWLQCNTGRILMPLERYDEATARYSSCREIFVEHNGIDHASLAWPLIGLAEVDMASGRPEIAEPRLRRALALRRADPDTGRQRIATAAGRLGDCLLALGRFAEAEPLLDERYALRRDLYPEGHRNRLEAAEALARLHAEWPNPERAAEFEATLTAERSASGDGA